MKATSLSVNLWAPCNAKCPFCISRTTWKTGRHDNGRLLNGMRAAINLMKWHRVDTLLITSNGEPLCVKNDVFRVLRYGQEGGIPIMEMQTNGAALDATFLHNAAERGLGTLAISIADPDPVRSAEIMGLPSDYDYRVVVKMAVTAGYLVRISLNLTKGHFPGGYLERFTEYVRSLAKMGVQQVTVRELGMPSQTNGSKKAEAIRAWVEENQDGMGANLISRLLEDYGHPLRELSYGNTVYAFEGCAVAVATCMTSNPNPDEIRSLILMPDGGVYHDWDHQPASRIL
jgi:molybdenum cofactor biosynthesis enzyme MoaA